jgi:hypothetical protein
MAFRAGTVSFVMLDNVAGSLTNLSSYADNFAWPQSVETVDVSVFGTAAKAFINGLTDGDTVTMSGPLDATLHTHLTAVKAAQSAGSSTMTVTWGPGGSVSGQPKISAETWVTQYAPATAVGGRMEYSATLQVTGAVTNATW